MRSGIQSIGAPDGLAQLRRRAVRIALQARAVPRERPRSAFGLGPSGVSFEDSLIGFARPAPRFRPARRR